MSVMNLLVQKCPSRHAVSSVRNFVGCLLFLCASILASGKFTRQSYVILSDTLTKCCSVSTHSDNWYVVVYWSLFHYNMKPKVNARCEQHCLVAELGPSHFNHMSESDVDAQPNVGYEEVTEVCIVVCVSITNTSHMFVVSFLPPGTKSEQWKLP